jgi:hypothetical protein
VVASIDDHISSHSILTKGVSARNQDLAPESARARGKREIASSGSRVKSVARRYENVSAITEGKGIANLNINSAG